MHSERMKAFGDASFGGDKVAAEGVKDNVSGGDPTPTNSMTIPECWQGWNVSEQDAISKITALVPTKNFQAGQASSDSTTLKDFLVAYPELEIVELSGDGSSCQFEAVGKAACGSHEVATVLRKGAVQAIQENWESLSAFALGEIASQAGIDEANDRNRQNAEAMRTRMI